MGDTLSWVTGLDRSPGRRNGRSKYFLVRSLGEPTISKEIVRIVTDVAINSRRNSRFTETLASIARPFEQSSRDISCILLKFMSFLEVREPSLTHCLTRKSYSHETCPDPVCSLPSTSLVGSRSNSVSRRVGHFPVQLFTHVRCAGNILGTGLVWRARMVGLHSWCAIRRRPAPPTPPTPCLVFLHRTAAYAPAGAVALRGRVTRAGRAT